MEMSDFEYFFNEMNKHKNNKNRRDIERESDLADIADLFYRIFQSLQVAGFERDEALEVLIAIIYAGGKN